MFVTWGEGRRLAFHVGKEIRETRQMIGKLDRLKTRDKSSTVASINELHNRIKTMEDKARWRTRQMADKREAEGMDPNDFEWTAPPEGILPEFALIRDEHALMITPPGGKPEFMACNNADQARSRTKQARQYGAKVEVITRVAAFSKWVKVDEAEFFSRKEESSGKG